MKKIAYKRWVVIKNLMKNLMKKKKDVLPDMVCAVFTPVDGDRDNLRAIVKHMSARMQDMGYNVSKVGRLSAQPSTPSTAQSTPADGDRDNLRAIVEHMYVSKAERLSREHLYIIHSKTCPRQQVLRSHRAPFIDDIGPRYLAHFAVSTK